MEQTSWWRRWRGRNESTEDPAWAALDDEAFLDAIYLKYLGRSTDPTGRDFYLRRLQSPQARRHVMRTLQNSEEGRAYQEQQQRVALLNALEQQEQQFPPIPSIGIAPAAEQPRLAILGTCLMEGLLRTALAAHWPVRHYLMDSGPHDPVPPLPVGEQDAVLVQLTLRSLLSLVTDGGDGDLFHLRPDLDWNLLRESTRRPLTAMVERVLAGLPEGIPVFFLSFLEPAPQINGILGRNRQKSLYALIRDLNDALEEQLASHHHAFYLELNDLRLHYGDSTAYDGHVSHFTHGGLLGSRQGDLIHLGILDKVRAALRILQGEHPVKLIITDLDNTLWKGVLAEADEIIPLEVTEGWPLGYAEALLACKARGLLLAICSKNDAASTRENFVRVWGRRLRLEDFCSVQTSWEPKPAGIARILAETNILPEHVLFIDDNPLEIAEVSHAYPAMRTLSGDPERWRYTLLHAAETQVAEVSEESARRTELIQAKKAREEAAGSQDRDAWLSSLQLTLRMEVMADAAHPRYARALELLNKTNQFNTTGQRWSGAEMQDWLASGGALLAASAEDRFAPHGLIALALLRNNVIEQVVLSCRIFGLGIETALLAAAVRQIQAAGHPAYLGYYTPTGRNDACRDFWSNHGCTWDAEAQVWRGDVVPVSPAWIHLNGSKSDGLHHASAQK